MKQLFSGRLCSSRLLWLIYVRSVWICFHACQWQSTVPLKKSRLNCLTFKYPMTLWRWTNRSGHCNHSVALHIDLGVTRWLNIGRSSVGLEIQRPEVRTPSGAQEKNCESFFRMKNVVLTRCRCAQTSCIRMITYAR